MSAVIDLYTFGTGNGRRASIALEECGLPYRVHKVDFAKGEQTGAAYRAICPSGKIPAIVDPDGPGGKPLTLSESGAILLYCAEKSGKFLPADPQQRLQAIRWTFHAVSDAGEPISAYFRLQRVKETADEVFAFFRGRLIGFMKDLDAHLAGRDYLLDDISIADLAFYTNVDFAHGQGALAGLEHVQRWHKAMAARPGVQRGMAVPA